MAKLRLDPEGIRNALTEMIENYEDLDLGGPGDDLRGHGTDPRSSFLVGCMRNCNSADALEEISSYMNRLRGQIANEPGISRDVRAKALRIHGHAVESIKACVRRVG